MIYVAVEANGRFCKAAHICGSEPAADEKRLRHHCGRFRRMRSGKNLGENLKLYGELPFTVLFLDGNYENSDLLNTYPEGEWRGGKVHIIKPDILHLMRGQVFELEGNIIFTFGGATSIDKYMRQEGVSWWKEEMPSFAELDEGIANLKRYNNKVDYIITSPIPAESGRSCIRPCALVPFRWGGKKITSCFLTSMILSHINIGTLGTITWTAALTIK